MTKSVKVEKDIVQRRKGDEKKEEEGGEGEEEKEVEEKEVEIEIEMEEGGIAGAEMEQ